MHPGWIALGIAFIVLWALAHVVLLGLSFTSGLLLDIALVIFKSVSLPGLMTGSQSMQMAWVTPLQIGILLTGLAGIPAGLLFFLQNRRSMLWLAFSLCLLLGVAFDLYAVFRLFADSFQGLS